jgi:hypothetical protein
MKFAVAEAVMLIFQFIAVLAATLFTGAAIYINVAKLDAATTTTLTYPYWHQSSAQLPHNS